MEQRPPPTESDPAVSDDSAAFDPTTERGLHNPRMLDLIQLNDSGSSVELHIIEFRPWSESFQNELEEKFNNYLDYVLDGHLVAQYPAYDGKPITLVLQYTEEPTEEHVTLFAVIERYVNSIGWQFASRKRDGV